MPAQYDPGERSIYLHILEQLATRGPRAPPRRRDSAG